MPSAQIEKRIDAPFFQSVHCVHFNDEINDPDLCKGMSTGLEENAVCIKTGCLSPWKACPVCISQGELEKVADLLPELCCEEGKNLCKFHGEHGVSARRKNGILGNIKETESHVVSSDKNPEIPEKIIGNVFWAGIDSIIVFKEQPRDYFSKSRILELADSIKEFGQLNPVILKKLPPGDWPRWELIDGENRFRACKLAGLKEIKAIEEKPENSQKQHLMSVVANFCRQGHTPMEVARAIQKIKNDFGYSEIKIGAILGKSVSWINFHASLLNLHEDIQKRLEPDCPLGQGISFSLAVALAMREKNKNKQLILVKRIKAENLNDKRAKALIRDETEGAISKRRKAGKVRGRVPSDDYAMFTNFLKRTADDLSLHLRGGERGFNRLFEYRSDDDRKEALRRCREIMEDFENVVSFLED